MSWNRCGVLGDDADRVAQRLQRQVAHVDPADRHAAGVDVVDPRDQLRDGGLAGAGRTDQRDQLAGVGAEAHPVQHRVPRAVVGHGDVLQRGQRDLVGARVGEVHVDELDRLLARRQRGRRPGFSVISGFRSSTSKTRSNETSALITSTRTLDSAVSGPYSRVSSSASETTAPGSSAPFSARVPPSP